MTHMVQQSNAGNILQSGNNISGNMSMCYIPGVVVMMHHYDHEAGRPTMTMRLVWCGAGWFGVTWRVEVCCGAAWCGFVWCGWLDVDSGCLLWVSTLGLYTVCLNWRLDRAGWAHRKAGWMGAMAK